MSYRYDLGDRTFTAPDGSAYTKRVWATDEHDGPFGSGEEGVEMGTDGFMKLTETPKGHGPYVNGVAHPDAATRVGLVIAADGRLTVTFDPGTSQAALIGVCRAPGA